MSNGRSGGGRFWLGLLAVIVIAVVVISGTGGDGTPYDPKSVDPNGAKGIVEVLEDLGAEVDIDAAVPSDSATGALLLRDRLTVTDRNALLAWVGRGGTLVVADPFSEVASVERRLLTDQETVVDAGECTIERLGGADSIEVTFALEMTVTRGDRSCFGDGSWAHIVEIEAGDGTIVVVGGQQLFTNDFLDESDAAVVAVNLVAPEPSGAQISIIAPSVLATDEPRTLNELLGLRVQNGLLMAAFAFLLFAFYRARRFGRVVQEPLPVPIQASELVLRHGNLEHRSKDPSGAVTVLRRDAVRRVGAALHVDPVVNPDAPADRHEALTVELLMHPVLTGRHDNEALQRALRTPVTTDEDLVLVAQLLSQIEATALEIPEPIPETVP